jgi:hypothetical protein
MIENSAQVRFLGGIEKNYCRLQGQRTCQQFSSVTIFPTRWRCLASQIFTSGGVALCCFERSSQVGGAYRCTPCHFYFSCARLAVEISL